MQPNFAIKDTEWTKLISDVAHDFDDLTLKRGFQYYKQKRVRVFRMISERMIMALVEGREDYTVTVELGNLALSHCDCPVSGPCKHMAAVLMNYAEDVGRSVHSVANAKAAAEQLAAAPVPAGGVSLRQRGEDLKKLALLIPDGTVQQWHEYMVLTLEPLAHTVRNPQYADRALAAVTAAQPKMSPAAVLLYKLHAQLFVLESLVKPGGQPGGLSSLGYSVGYYTSIAISELQKQITDMMKKGLPLAEAPEEWPRVYDTIAYLRRAMLSESRDRSREQPYFSYCYALLWENWITPGLSGPQLYTEELEALRKAGSGLNTPSSRQPQLLAESRMHYYLRDDTAALEQLRLAAEERPGLHPEELMSFLSPLAETGQWPRLTAWLAEIGPLLGSRLYNLRHYAGYWDEAVRHLPEAEPLMWDTLSGMLPLSRETYEEQLLAYGKWQDWMDMLLSSGSQPGDFRVSDLQPIEKNAPELLLPFYHQAVERFVLEKNRHSYKAAVKLMKRLAKLYKKLKREARWEEFLEAFMDRHSRLRALQEELRKGKLIP